MAVATSRISVEVLGTSTELQEALAKASDALKNLGVVVAKEAQNSLKASESTVKSNQTVTDSYVKMANGAKKSSLVVVESWRTQMAAQKEAAASAAGMADEQAAASEKTASAATKAADAQVRAAEETKAAQVESADAAAASANKQIAASAKVADANKKASASTVASATKNDAAFAAGGGALTKLGKTTVLSAAAVAGASLYMSAKYEKAIMQFHTQAGVGITDTRLLGKEMLKMAGEVGARPNELAAGMYHVVSSMNNLLPATHRVAIETGILREAMKGAAIGDSNKAETTYVLSAAMNALGRRSVPLAAQTMAELNAIVGTGDMHMQDLVGAMSTGLLPAVQNFHVGLQSVGAALAFMADRGVPAQQAATRLRMAVTMMGAPTKMAAGLLRDVGLSSTEAVDRSKAMSAVLEAAGLNTTKMAHDLSQPDGLLVALRDLKTHMEDAGVTAQGQAALIARAFGGARSGTAIEMLFQHPEILEAKFKQQGKVIREYGSDWTATKTTLTFEAKQMEASVEALGIKLGEDLTPEAKALLGDLRETADWFAHNEAAAIALAGTIGGVLTLAVTAFTVNKLAKLVQGLKQAQTASGWLRAGFRSPANAAAAGAAASTVTGAGPLGALEGKAIIGGARSGLGLPGSMMNPLVVAIEAGQYAGLGGEAASGTVLGSSAATERSAVSEAEGKTSAAVPEVLPAGGVKEASAVEGGAPATNLLTREATNPAVDSAAMSASVMSGIRSSIGKLADGLLKGGLVAGVGVMGSQIAGSAIGGKTGKTVASLGTDAALGAAIGTVIEPGIGTAVGAALGGIGGEVMHLLGGTQGSKAAAAAQGMGAGSQKELQQGIDKANSVAAESLRHIQNEGTKGLEKWGIELSHTLHTVSDGIIEENRGENKPGKRAKEEIQERKNSELYATGKKFGGQMVTQEIGVTQGMSGPAQVTAVITDIEKRFKGLPAATQKGAFDSIMAMVKEYQKDGKLPPTAVEEIINTIGSKFPSLKQAFSMAGSGSIQALNQALKGQSVLNNIEALVNQWTNVFPTIPKVVGLNMSDASKIFAKTNQEMLALAHSGPESQRIAATEAYKHMHDEEIQYFSTMRGGIESEIKHLSSRMGPLTATGTVALEGALKRMVEVIENEMHAGVKSTAKGTAEINNALKGELKALGMKTPAQLNKAPGGAFGPQPGSGGGGGGNKLMEGAMGGVGGFTGAARGALIQVGKQGDRGRDSVPFVAGGVPIITAPGEQIAVFTHQQQAIANHALSHVGGLPGLFSQHKTPNYMATGGFVAEPGTNFSYGDEPRIVADLRKLAIQLKETVYGISGYRSPAHSVAVGGFGDDPHTEGKAADIGVGSPSLASMMKIAESMLKQVGLYRPFYPPDAAEANHVQLIGVPFGKGSAPAPGGGAAGGVGGEGGVSVPQISVPKVPGNSIVSAIVRNVLAQSTAAANQQLGGAGGFGGVKGSGGTPSANERLGRAMMVAAGYAPTEWPSLQALWTQESGWNANAVNPSSGAAGIAQSLGHGSVPLGNARAQIAWGLKYIRERYGNPAHAEAHERAFKWYEQGGMLDPQHFAGGGKVEHSDKAVSKSAAAKAKSVINKGKGTKSKLQKQAALKVAKQFGSLSNIQGLSEVPTMLSPFEKALEGLANQESLMDSMASDTHGYFLLPGDMQYIQPTLQPGQNMYPGMNVTDAQNVARNAIAQAKEETEALKLQSELLSWISGQESHRLLTGSDVSILSGTFKAAGLAFPQGSSLLGDEKQNLQAQLTWMGTSAGAQYTGTERGLLEHIQKMMQAGQDERHKRNERIHKVQESAYTRYTHLKDDLKRLTTGSLKDREKAAVDTYYEKVRQFDADEHKRTLRDTIAEEKKAPHPDKEIIAEHEKELRGIVAPKPPNSRAVTAAHLAVMKNEISNQLPPIEETLKLLGGSSTTIGTGGKYGKNRSENQTIIGKEGEAEADLATLVTSKIPSTLMSLRSVEEAMIDSPVPIQVTAANSQSNSQLTALLEQQNTILETNYAVSQAQAGVISGMISSGLPKYLHGGLVANTGLALVHEGEWIAPNPRGPYGSQLGASHPASAPHVEVNHSTHVHGNAAALIDAIDSRIQHPRNVEAVSKQIMRRGRGLPSFGKRGV